MRATKDSGVDWLGEVPAKWETSPLRTLMKLRNERNTFYRSDNYLSLMANVGIIPYAEKGDVGNKAPEDLGKCKIVSEGDFVLNSMNFGIGSFGVSAYNGVCSSVYVVMEPRLEKAFPSFLRYIFSMQPFQKHVQSLGNGILEHRAAIGWDELKNIGFPMPDRDEQRRIADFLDRETAKIDALIAKQEQLITTLDERRQALISTVIMKGLDKNSTVSTTSVDHYEATPSSWSWVRLKDVAEITPSNVDKKTYEGGTPVSLCNYVDAYYNELITANLNFMSATATPEEIRKFELKQGWVIITKDSEDASDIGIAAYVPEDLPNVVCGYHLSIVRPKVGVSGLFLKWFFDSTMTKGFMAERSNGLTRMALGQGAISTLPICLPPFAEQEEIANYLLETTTKVDELIRNSRNVVGLLRERRQALISAAVTGKLEVTDGYS